MARQPLVGQGLLIVEASQTHHTRKDSSERVISPLQRPLPDFTQHPQEPDIHAPGRIRTRNPRKRAAADPRLRPCGHWDRPETCRRGLNNTCVYDSWMRILLVVLFERIWCFSWYCVDVKCLSVSSLCRPVACVLKPEWRNISSFSYALPPNMRMCLHQIRKYCAAHIAHILGRNRKSHSRPVHYIFLFGLPFPSFHFMYPLCLLTLSVLWTHSVDDQM